MFRLAFKMLKADDIRVENITALHLKEHRNRHLGVKYLRTERYNYINVMGKSI